MKKDVEQRRKKGERAAGGREREGKRSVALALEKDNPAIRKNWGASLKISPPRKNHWTSQRLSILLFFFTGCLLRFDSRTELRRG